MLFRCLPPAHFICKTIYQQSLRQPLPICTREFCCSGNTAAESLRLHSANESCSIVSSQLAMIKKKKGRLVRKLKFSQIEFLKAATAQTEASLSFNQTRRLTLLYRKTLLTLHAHSTIAPSCYNKYMRPQT